MSGRLGRNPFETPKKAPQPSHTPPTQDLFSDLKEWLWITVPAELFVFTLKSFLLVRDHQDKNSISRYFGKGQ